MMGSLRRTARKVGKGARRAVQGQQRSTTILDCVDAREGLAFNPVRAVAFERFMICIMSLRECKTLSILAMA
jgi:hypothetical protein